MDFNAPYLDLNAFQIQATSTAWLWKSKCPHTPNVIFTTSLWFQFKPHWCSTSVSLYVTNPSTTQFIFVVLHLNLWIFSLFLPIMTILLLSICGPGGSFNQCAYKEIESLPFFYWLTIISAQKYDNINCTKFNLWNPSPEKKKKTNW